MFKKILYISTHVALLICPLSSQMHAEQVEQPVLQKICPTEELKKLNTFDDVECYLIYGTDLRFGKFLPLDPQEDFANLPDGTRWRLFKTERETPDEEGILCHKTIMLKSIVKHINSLSEVQNLCKLEFANSDGVFSTVVLLPQAQGLTESDERLLKRLHVFVSSYLNAFAQD